MKLWHFSDSEDDTISGMTGYSKKDLLDKLGVRAGMRVIVLHAPEGYRQVLDELETHANLMKRLGGRFDLIQYFAVSEEQVSAVMPNLALSLNPNGMVWMCWVKRTSSLHTGLDENTVRAAGISAGLVDVKVAAIDDDWSGLKFVYRLRDR
jgi:hypothetical protein